MEKIVITGIGWASSIGSTGEAVDKILREGLTGVVPAKWPENLPCPIKLWAPVKGFDAQGDAAEDWRGPNDFTLPMEVLRSIPPSGFYSFWSVKEALINAGLDKSQITDGRTGLYSASAGSVRLMYRHLKRMYDRGVM